MKNSIILLIILIMMIMLIKSNLFLMCMITNEFFIIIILFFKIYYDYLNMWIFMTYLILSVCEAILGLAILTSLNMVNLKSKINILSLMW